MTETLHRSAQHELVRAVRERDGQPVLLEILSAEAGSEAVARLRREFELLRRFADDPRRAVARVLELTQHEGRWIMSMVDDGGVSLAAWLEQRRPSSAQVLELAVALTQAVAVVHDRGIVHARLELANLLISAGHGGVSLIDFAGARELADEQAFVTTQLEREGSLASLAYLAPEQSGRVNRPVDQRTDLYALGVVLYRLATGELPFTGADPLELIHAHLARIPQPPHERDASVPEPLSRIIMTLLAKDPEDRYQSARGLLADLQACRERRLGELRVQDRVAVFEVPERLYGREREAAALLAACERATGDRSEVVVLCGRSGIGKSALVHELKAAMLGRPVSFAAGKFDQQRRDTPYEALVASLRVLLQDILGESPVGEPLAKAIWRERIAAAVGDNGQLIIDLLPELELLIGPQPAVAELGASEARNRFRYTMERFVAAFASRERALALFLDDLQWADRPSLELLGALMRSAEQSLCLMLSYRDDEVEAGHGVLALLDMLEQDEVPITRLQLTPLSEAVVTALVADTVHRAPAEVASLAAVIRDKTGGNPFFLTRFLRMLHERELLRYSWEQARWCWDEAAVAGLPITDNVVDLVISQLAGLPEDCRRALAHAAWLGNAFELQTLAAALAVTPAEADRALWPAVAHDLLVHDPSGHRFIHDRVQDGARALLSADERRTAHLRAARFLRTRAAEDSLFEMIAHAIAARSLLDRDEQLELARSILVAGRRAIRAAALDAAHKLLATGIELLGEPDDAWAHQHALSLDLHDALIEAVYLAGDYEAMEARARAVIEACRDPLEQVNARVALIHSLSERLRMTESVAEGRRFLALLGMDIPTPLRMPRAMFELLGVWHKLERGGLARLTELPEVQDPLLIARFRVMSSMMIGAVACEPQLLLLINSRSVRMALAHGMHADVNFALAGIAFILTGPIGKQLAGIEVVRVAQELVESRGYERVYARVEYMAHAYMLPWVSPVHESIAELQEIFVRGQSLGDNEFASLAGCLKIMQSVFTVADLEGALEQFVDVRRDVHRLGRLTAIYVVDVYTQLVCNIVGRSEDPVSLTGEYWPEQEHDALARFGKDNDLAALMLYYMAKTFAAAIHGDYAEAARVHRESAPARLVQSAQAPVFPWFRILGVVSGLAVVTQPRARGARAALRGLRAELAYLRKIAGLSHENFGFGLELVLAERARITGRREAARRHYQQAIELTRAARLIGMEAICRERQARFMLGEGEQEAGSHALERARQTYDVWGARARLRQLDEEFPRPERLADHPSSAAIEPRSATGLDVASMFKAAQAIAGEIELVGLVRRLLALAMENAGADGAFVILVDDDGERQVHGPDGTRRSLAEADGSLSRALVLEVFREGQSVLVQDAIGEPEHRRDPYVRESGVRSLACLPIVRQGQLRAVLYLENRQLAGAFTAARLEVLDVLAAMTAIALDNAALYHRAEQQVHALEARNREIQALNDELRRQINQRSERLMQLLGNASSTSEGDLRVGSMLGDCYRVVGQIGSGGMGVVYEVERTTDGRALAAKLLRSGPQRRQLSRFMREAQILAKLSHPNLIAIHDVDVTTTGMVYIVMELVPGQSLREAMDVERPLGWWLTVVEQVARALAVLHEQSVIHRDLKPENILVVASPDDPSRPQVKLADFGIAIITDEPHSVELDDDGDDDDDDESDAEVFDAHASVHEATGDPIVGGDTLVDAEPRLTQTGVIIGTPNYLAPELARGSKRAQPPADVFSLGIVAYECLVGARPFAKPAVWLSDGQEQPTGLRQRGDLPEPVLELLERSLAWNPDARPSADELARCLRDALALLSESGSHAHPQELR